ncbi:MAG: hypothetical protein GXY73_01195 [Methanothrix sp.]|jgi:hypothetical protein|nr:hypothetical protein [Methanothrix sp.]
MRIHDKEIFAVAPVTCICRDLKSREYPIGNATGFFYSYDGQIYFITNRHVVIDEEVGYYPERLNLKLHKDRKDLTKNRPYKICLYDDDKNDEKKPLWLEHPQNRDRNIDLIDLVALPIEKNTIGEFYIEPFQNDKDLLPETEDLILSGVHGKIEGYSIWVPLQVMGYPEGHYDRAHNLPIIRSATLASVINVPFDRKPKCIIDAQLHKGTSGSPVIVRPGYYYDQHGYPHGNFPSGKDTNKYLLGVHSGEFDQQHPELGLHNVWFARLIRDIIKQNCKYFDSMKCKLEVD